MNVETLALTADDWQRWRALRLAALAEAPAVFGSTLAGWTAAAYPGQGVVLSVHADNLAARRLYARHGFVDAGPSPDDPGELRMVHAVT